MEKIKFIIVERQVKVGIKRGNNLEIGSGFNEARVSFKMGPGDRFWNEIGDEFWRKTR